MSVNGQFVVTQYSTCGTAVYGLPLEKAKSSLTWSHGRHKYNNHVFASFFSRALRSVMHGSILPVTIPPPGIPPGICNFFLTWRSILHPRARRKRQFPTPGTPHRPPTRCFVAKPDVLARTSTIF